MASVPERKVIGKGAFGCVIKPALPNQGVEYPQNVTKLYKDKKQYEDVYARSKSVYEHLGHNQGQRINQYTQQYTAANLSNTLQAICDFNTPTMPVYPLRMPDLGVTFYQMQNITIVQKIQKIPIPILVEQIRKLFQQVKAIQDTGFIHGDIREMNLMINPLTGKITLIDFDWLMPVKEFYSKYQFYLGFYSNPPESLLSFPMYEILKYMTDPTTVKTKTEIESTLSQQPSAIYNYQVDGTIKLVTDTINPIVTQFIAEQTPVKERYERYVQKFNTSKILMGTMTESSLQLINNMNYNTLYQAAYAQYGSSLTVNLFLNYYYSTMAKTFDSFGLAFSLLFFLHHVFPMIESEKYTTFKESIKKGDESYTDAEAKKYYDFFSALRKTILHPMLFFKVIGRLEIGEGLSRLESLITQFEIETGAAAVAEGGRRRRRKQKAITRRRKSPGVSARVAATSSKIRRRRR